MTRVAIVVTHLLGTGHLARALVLARAFSDAGNKTLVLSGGVPVPHFDTSGITFEQLPPLRSDGVNFTQLLTAEGTEADSSYKAARCAKLRQSVHDFAPDVMITELFPFGRRVLRTEFTDLLEMAATMAPRPKIFCSIRDILAPPSKPAKADATHALVAEHYDGVLVHADPDITTLEDSWPVTPALASRLHYTGYVANPPASDHPAQLGKGEVLVSAGGGNVGAALYAVALEAAAQDASRCWRILVGGTDARERAAALCATAPANVIAEPARADFRQMLRHAAASVSMCGYNTALDLLQAGTPAVLVPFDAGAEVEQSLRARALARRDGFEFLAAADITSDSLRRAVDRVIAAPKRGGDQVQMAGAQRSVEIVMAWGKGSQP